MSADLSRVLRRLLAGLALLAPWAEATVAQERQVVSKVISIAQDEATLSLELSAGPPLEVSFESGIVRVGDAELGTYTPELEASWRALLAAVVALDGGPLTEALRGWEPPQGLEREALLVALALDASLEDALDQVAAPELPATARTDRALASLLRRPERVAELAAALEGARLGAEPLLHVAESAEVAAGTSIDGAVILVDADLVVRGTVEGDVILVGGTLRLEDGGRVEGDVRVADGRLEQVGGALGGTLIEMEPALAPAAPGEVDPGLREEMLRELREELEDDRGRPGFTGRVFSPFRGVARAISGVFSTLMTAAALSLLGAVVLHFAGKRVEIVADAARRSPGRAAAVGFAGAFLAVPVWLLGVVALAISLIGIPIAIVWIPVFPLAVILAAGLGYYAVARNVGAWIARRDFPYLGWVRTTHPATLVAGGVLGLLSAFLVANVLAIAGDWLEFLRGLFIAGGVVMTVWAVLAGFGAVLLTRGGQRPEYDPGVDFFGSADDDLDPTAPVGAPI